METKETTRHRVRLRRGKLIATLAAVMALAGAVQAVGPTSALAMRSQCSNLFYISQSYYNHNNFTMGAYYAGKFFRCEEVAEAEEQVL